MAQTAIEPLVSVVIPAHNAAATIGETLVSVLQQTFENFEVLVIDNASSDATATVVGEISDPRIQHFFYDQTGVSFARNRGIEMARGKYIALLDADDLWLPEKLATQLEGFAGNPDAGLIFCWCDSVDERGAFLKKGNYVQLEEPVYEQMIQWNLLENTSSPMIRKDVFAQVGNFNENLRIAEDWDLWLRIACNYQLICIPKVLVHYRVQRNSASLSNVSEFIESTLSVLGDALDRLQQTEHRNGLEQRAKANLYHYLAMRLIETGAGRATGLEAARYWWRSIKERPGLFANFRRSTLLGSAIAAIIILPPDLYKRLRRSWSQRHKN